MFTIEQPRSTFSSLLKTAELIFHVAVRNVRKSNGNAVVGLLMNIGQTVLLLVMFSVITNLLGSSRASLIRGDKVLNLMSGIFMFMTFNKTMGAVSGADGPTSSMMLHAPMNTLVAILSAMLGAVYLQILSASVVLYTYHAVFGPITIRDPVGAMAMLLLSCVAGAGVGMLFRGARPWAPGVIGIVNQVFMRANFIASGKMFLANNAPARLRMWFDWNPLFHTIDQGRGFIFLNYNPHFTSIEYPVKVALTCIVIGMMGEHFTSKHMSMSWGAKG
ncbi:MAG: ABC transporter permease [Gemmobacter sp.]|jgi:ABC-type polysaccharide/polyol phosphate export permease|nr:ABC transporter permease [Gemmobacter sp.]